MGLQAKRVDATLEAAKAIYGKKQCRTIVLNATDTAVGLDGVSIELNRVDAQGNETLGGLWFDLDNGSGTAPAGFTEVDVTTGDSVATILAAMETAMGTDYEYAKDVANNKISIQNRFIGEVTAEADPSAAAGIESYSLDVEGFRLDLGATSGAIELALEGTSVDIVSNQTGALVTDQIFQGSNATISMSLIEVSKERFDALVGSTQGDVLEVSGGTSLSGYGESRLFQSLFSLGGTLILHPIRLEDTDYSSDVIFWNCAPNVSGQTFDGTAVSELGVEFVAYLDSSKNKKINLFARGDWTQDGLNA